MRQISTFASSCFFLKYYAYLTREIPTTLAYGKVYGVFCEGSCLRLDKFAKCFLQQKIASGAGRRFLWILNLSLGVMLVFSCLGKNADEHIGVRKVDPLFEIVSDGVANATLVLPENPVKAEKLAAAELNEHIELVTGTRLPVKSEDDAGEGRKIWVGNTKAARASGVSVDQLGAQEYVVKFIPGGIIIAGRDKEDHAEFQYRVVDKKTGLSTYDTRTWPGWWDERGTLQATYEFLRGYCGIRWFDFTRYGTDYSPRSTLAVKSVDIKRSPSFLMRDVFTERNPADYPAACLLWNPKSDEFARYMKMAFPAIAKKVPDISSRGWRDLISESVYAYLLRNGNGGTGYFHPNHSFYDYYARFWQPDKRFPKAFEDRRSEFFAKGNPERDKPPQLCYTDDKLVEQVVEDAENWFDNKPFGLAAHTPRGKRKWDKSWPVASKYYPVVPMDNHAYCKCENCRKLWGAHTGGAYAENKGMFSNYVFDFVNKVAKRIKETRPNRKIGALAYAMYMDTPDKIKLEDNIMVMVCPVLRNVYSTSRQRADREMLKKWSESGAEIYLWLYYCFPRERSVRSGGDWHVFPGFFAHHLAWSFKEYKALDCRGMYFNGFGQEVEAYLTFRLLNDVDLDIDTLLDEYFNRMYGPAGSTLRKLYCLIENIYCDPANYSQAERDRSRQNENIAWGLLGSHERMKEIAALINEARKKIQSGDSLRKKRFQLFDLSVLRYIEEGRRKYVAKHDKPRMIERICCAPLVGASPNGDLSRVDWEDAQEVGIWASCHDEPVAVTPRTKVTHDDVYLYLQTKVALDGEVREEKWRILFLRKLEEKMNIACEYVIPLDYSAKGVKSEVKTKDGVEYVDFAIPLSQLTMNKNMIYLNIERIVSGRPVSSLMPIDDDNSIGFVAIKLENGEKADGKIDRSNLVARWDFSGEGTLIVDSSEGKNDAKLNNSVSSRELSPFGSSLRLFRRMGCEYFSVDKWSGVGDDFTVCAWLRIEPTTRVARHKLPYTLLAFQNGEIAVSDYKLKIGMRKPSFKLEANRLLSPDEWDYVVVVSDQSGTELFVNGHLAGSSKKRFRLPAKDAEVFVGADLNRRHHCQFRGGIAEIEIYDRAMSSNEIGARYRQGLNRIHEYNLKNTERD